MNRRQFNFGMIFIPSVGGISHSPKEFSRPKDIENGANVLLQTWNSADNRGRYLQKGGIQRCTYFVISE